LSSYVASSFQQHSLSNLPTQLSDAFSAACYIPVAKILDTWGRPQGFALMASCATIGMILMASCNSFAVYCAGNIFFYMGFGGMEYCVDVITADMSQLKNRGLAYAFTSSPYIITAFAGPKVADEFYYQVSWRWGYGAWAIIFPCFALPLYLNLKWNLHKAQKAGKIVREESGRTLPQSIAHWFMEFDSMFSYLIPLGISNPNLPFNSHRCLRVYCWSRLV
jgi:MFS family permease